MNKNQQSDYFNLPNCITSVRIVGTVALLFTFPLSIAFYVIYTLCGLSDATDGWVARKRNQSTAFGAKLDSIADLFFYIVMLLKLLPILWRQLPIWIWYAVGSIVLIRIACYVTVAIKFRRFAAVHSRLNKVTGLAVFLLPYAIMTPIFLGYSVTICGIAAVAAIQELCLHIIRPKYVSNQKSLL